MSSSRLSDAAAFTDTRVDATTLTVENYIGTDNILQNKEGKKDSSYVPTTGKTAAYKAGDILIANIRPYLKKIWFATNNGGSSADVTTLRVKDGFDPKFIYYNLFQDEFFDYAMKGAKGSKMPRLDKKQILDFPIQAPDLIKQKSIARTLSLLDDKITLNRQISAKLETLAQDLYTYWFVQFEFPDVNNRPYKTSGGVMVFNEELKYEIPVGWSTKRLDDIIARIGTGLNPRKNFSLGSGSNYYVTIKNIRDGKIVIDNRCDRIDDKALGIIDKRSDLRAGDILFTSIEPVGTTYLILRKPTNWNINESVFTIRPNLTATTPEFLFQLLSSSHMKSFTGNSSSGSVHKGIRHGVLRTFPLAYPSDKNLINMFSKEIKPMLEKIDNLDQESARLIELRDWLLPMLMNGQIEVG